MKKIYVIWITLLSIVLIIGAATIIGVFVKGHGSFFHADDNVPWTLLIAAYVYFILTSTGVTFIASLPTVFGYKQYYPIAKRGLLIGIVCLFAGFISIGMELGNPFKMIYYVLSPNFSSPIWWMGFFYSLLLGVLLLKFYKIHMGDWNSKFSKVLSYTAFVVEIAAISTLGNVFGLIEARPAFFGEFIPIYFLLTALMSGLAALISMSLIYFKVTLGKIPEIQENIMNKLSKILGLIVGIALLLSIYRVVIGLYSNRPEFDVIRFLINSLPYKIEIFFGLMLPLAFLITPKIRNSFSGKLIATCLVMLGLSVGRMDLVMTGQIQPIMPKFIGIHSVIVYLPTVWEWIVGFFAMAFMLMLYTLAERKLNLDDTPPGN